ncbi:MAG: hypothetical protein QXN55_09090 [Candidatus Nitrosotenuis sp.]
MSYYEQRPPIWQTIRNLLIALLNAIRNGFASLVAAIRRALANYNYAALSYA